MSAQSLPAWRLMALNEHSLAASFTLKPIVGKR